MSILDIDKENPDRGTPNPNVKDKLNISQRMSHGTLSTNYQTPASNPNTSQGLLSGIYQLVSSGVVDVVNDGSSLTTNQFAHNLGYVPTLVALLNGASLASAIGTINNSSILLPTFLDASIGGDVAGVVTFRTWLYAFVDNQNVYVNLLNATGSARTANVSFYLYRTAATA